MTDTPIEQPNDPWEEGARWPVQLFEPTPIPFFLSARDDGSDEYEMQAALSDEASRRAMHPFSDLFNFQAQVGAWARRNFGEGLGNGTGSMMGLAEETGELAEAFLESVAFINIVATIGRLTHAHLKGEQGIRYTPEEIRAKKADAVGDLLVYLADYCGRAKLQMADCVGLTWREVRERDWVANPTNAAQVARDAVE